MSKIFVSIWVATLLTSLTIIILGTITSKTNNKISISNSTKGIVTIVNKQLVFSSSVICYFDKIIYNSPMYMFNINYEKYKKL